MEEEQQRGITMHTSAISLLYQQETKKEGGINNNNNNNNSASNYLINLVDSPG